MINCRIDEKGVVMKKEGLLGSNTRNRVYRPGSKDVDSIRESIRKARAQKRSTPKTSVSQREKTRDRTDCDRFLEEGFQSAYDGTYEDRCRFLNSLNVLIDETRTEALADPEFFEKLCRHVLRVLTDDHPAIRAMCFHLLRKTMLNERNLVVILTSHVDIYVVRALDLRVENDAERCEAFRLIACMISIYQGSNLKKLIVDSANEKNGKKFAFPKSIMQPVISIALAAMSASWSSVTSSESVYDDKMALPCIGLFCEFCLLEPDHILDMAGTDWIVRVLTGEARTNRRIVTLVAHIIVSWLDDPKMRAKAHLHLVLEQIFAPLIEFGFFQKYDAHAPKPAGRILTDNTGDVLENFKYSFLCILKTWSGLFACAAVGPDSTIMTSSPLRLLEYLGLGTVSPVGGSENLQRIRDMVVDICCEFVDLPYAAKNFVSWEEAAKFYETMHFADTYRASLKYDFILAQNEARLANDAEFTNTVDLVASFRFLALFVLINAGLPQSLARLILATPDSPSGLKASLLLADMLRAAPSIVPSGWRASLLSMPTLVQSACETLASCRSAAAIHHYKTDDLQSFDQQESYTYVNAQNAELVLHRFDQLNGKWIGIAADPTPDDSFLALFIPETLSVEAKRPPLASSPALKKGSRFPTVFLKMGRTLKPTRAGLALVRSRSLSSLLDCAIIHADNVESNDKGFGSSDSDDDEPNLNWIFTESLLRAINIESSEDRKVASSFAMVSLVSKVFSTLSPLIALEKRPLTSKRRVIVAKLAVEKAAQIIQRGGSSSSEYRSVLFRYAVDFRSALEKRENSRSALSVRNMVYNGSMLTFAIIGAMSSFSCTIDILNEVGVLQM
ncbi:unnamed protein product [Caenorhabditis auriculariae]|uniref:Rapamycin-insensitive companion of mTOR N-terminal domain-containing protein n=1 Tax=Caenorhabditis auriculariae TaxID=2777116 RepID=A0A8S1H7C9_9PELO|nr:unnamed protein product [Caenorhabditis auriculariae]